jgi:hypothetical protein
MTLHNRTLPNLVRSAFTEAKTYAYLCHLSWLVCLFAPLLFHSSYPLLLAALLITVACVHSHLGPCLTRASGVLDNAGHIAQDPGRLAAVSPT